MYTSATVFWFFLIHTCSSQLKACYQALDEELAGDFPCNPDATVSSCCASGNICSSNLYCISEMNKQNYVGTCTDKTWSSPACPFNLSSSCLLHSSFMPYQLKTTASASGAFNPSYDTFNYALNTTQCPDGTLCPFASNQNCCDKNQGVKEVHYNYTSEAIMPTDVAALTTFYAAAGYTFPTSIPSQSAPLTRPLPSTELQTAATPTLAATPSDPSLFVPASSNTSSHSDKIGLGIGIGIVLGVIISGICAILLYLYMRQRRRLHQQEDMQKDLTSPALTLVHNGSKELEDMPARSELGGLQEVHELQDFNAKGLER